MLIVAYTILSAIYLIDSLKLDSVKNCFKIFPNIFAKVFSLAFGMLRILKCLKNLGEGAVLPPPGGAAAHINVLS